MLPPASKDSCLGNPTSDMLAGVYLEIAAEEDFFVKPRQPPQNGSTGDSPGQPTPDQLAGVYVQVEAVEDLTVRHPPPA